jgi:hypothetical protein
VSERYTATDGGLIWEHISSSEHHIEASSIKYTEGIPLGYFIYFVIISDTMGGLENKQDTYNSSAQTDGMRQIRDVHDIHDTNGGYQSRLYYAHIPRTPDILQQFVVFLNVITF